MSSEKSLHTAAPELLKNAEQLEESGQEHLKELQEKLEQRAEQSTIEDIEAAKHAALELAEDAPEDDRQAVAEQQQEIRPITKADRDTAFNNTMNSVRKQMNPAERTFSKVIHNPVIEKTSQAVGATVARPNLILAGAIGGIIISTLVYLVAKNYGYPLSGFEPIGAFLIGWMIGAVVEYARVGFRGKSTDV